VAAIKRKNGISVARISKSTAAKYEHYGLAETGK
jgi:hypothetical protein